MVKQTHRWLFLLIIILAVACAPADLDITPTLAPTIEPSPTPPPVISVEETAFNEDQVLLFNTLLANAPETISAGGSQWRLDSSVEPEVVPDVQNGLAQKVPYTEPGGGEANITYGVFDTVEDAEAHYARFQNLRLTNAPGSFNDTFPTPNTFGRGLYGSYAIFQVDNIFVEAFITAFSSTGANPLTAFARAALTGMENGLAAFGEMETSTNSDTEEASPELSENEAILEAILAEVPNEILNALQWKRDFTRGEDSIDVVQVNNGIAKKVYFSDSGGSKMSYTFSVFDSPEDAVIHYENLATTRRQLEGGSQEDNYPQPNIFNISGIYGSNAVLQMNENIVVDVLIEQISGTGGNPLNSLARRGVTIVENATASE